MKFIFITILSVFIVLPNLLMAAEGEYDDWWICANKCAAEDPVCIDSCTDDFNETHSIVYPADLCIKVLTETGFLSAKNHSKNVSVMKGLKPKSVSYGGSPMCNTKPVFIPACPRGTEISIFDMPVYDGGGLFVKCFEPTAFCIPDDLEPEG